MNIINISKRLERLERIAPHDLVVLFDKNGTEHRTTVKEYSQICREDGVMYSFRIVDGTKFDDIDLITSLIDDMAIE